MGGRDLDHNFAVDTLEPQVRYLIQIQMLTSKILLITKARIKTLLCMCFR